MDATNEQRLREAAQILSRATRVAVLTGAGISAESGVPTFRGEGGFWRGQSAMELATLSSLHPGRFIAGRRPLADGKAVFNRRAIGLVKDSYL